MESVSLADAKAHLSEFIDRVEAGQPTDAARRGWKVARLTAIAAPRKRIDAASLRALPETMPPAGESAGSLM